MISRSHLNGFAHFFCSLFLLSTFLSRKISTPSNCTIVKGDCVSSDGPYIVEDGSWSVIIIATKVCNIAWCGRGLIWWELCIDFYTFSHIGPLHQWTSWHPSTFMVVKRKYIVMIWYWMIIGTMWFWVSLSHFPMHHFEDSCGITCY
jgi:hypothetical protein